MDLGKKELVKEVAVGKFNITAFCFVEKNLFFGDVFGCVNMVNLEKYTPGKDTNRRGGHEGWVTAIVASNQWVISGGEDGFIILRDSSLSMKKKLDVHKGKISALFLQNNILYSTALDFHIAKWDLLKIKQVMAEEDLRRQQEQKLLAESQQKKGKKKPKKKK